MMLSLLQQNLRRPYSAPPQGYRHGLFADRRILGSVLLLADANTALHKPTQCVQVYFVCVRALIGTTRRLIRSENAPLLSLLINDVHQEHWICNSVQFRRIFAEIHHECKWPAPLELQINKHQLPNVTFVLPEPQSGDAGVVQTMLTAHVYQDPSWFLLLAFQIHAGRVASQSVASQSVASQSQVC